MFVVLNNGYCPLAFPRYFGCRKVGISSVWFEGNPCNMHLLDLAKEVRACTVTLRYVMLRYAT